MTLRHIPDADRKMHTEGALRLLCRPFQSHETGLPEWLKNSSDAYIRDGTPAEDRIIVVMYESNNGTQEATVSCLDFVGMTSADIEGSFRVWADPEAATQGRTTIGVQGGHGNGGKCYMAQMFEKHAILNTFRDGTGNRYGVTRGSFDFGYFADSVPGRDFPIGSLRNELEKLLQPKTLATLCNMAGQLIDRARGLTLVAGVGPQGLSGSRAARRLFLSLPELPQMITTIQLCRVYALVGGVMLGAGPLTLPPIEPMLGAEQPRGIRIPPLLPDPVSGEDVSTTNGDRLTEGKLVLLTSRVSMRHSKKNRHKIDFKTSKGFIGYCPLTDVDVQSPYRERIYGECVLDALEPFKQNERGRLAEAPLTRAVLQFIAEQVQAYSAEFEATDRRTHDEADKDAISRMNDALDRWKNRHLAKTLGGAYESEGPGVPPSDPPLPTGKPVRIELSLSHRYAGVGVSFRPSIRFFDRNGIRIRTTPYRWVSYDTNVALVDEDLRIVNTFTPGVTRIWAETTNGVLRSNAVELEVVEIVGIEVVPDVLRLVVGSRSKFEAICRLEDGQKRKDVYLVWTENNPRVARVAGSGQVFGFEVGETEVVAGDDHFGFSSGARVQVSLPDSRQGGYPIVLVSDIHRDPDTGQTITLSPEDPPVYQRPQDADRNIWWINSSAPLARLYYGRAQGYGPETRECRMYHLERLIDIMVQIAMQSSPGEGEPRSVGEWITEWGEQAAQIQRAIAEELSSFIDEGIIPEG